MKYFIDSHDKSKGSFRGQELTEEQFFRQFDALEKAAVEFGAYGVRVNAIGPGVVETPLTEPIKANADWYGAYADKNALKRWAKAEEMVGPTLFLASDAASYVTGTILFADGGWTAVDGRFTPPGMG